MQIKRFADTVKESAPKAVFPKEYGFFRWEILNNQNL